MIYTDEMEKQISIGSSYLDCFKGVERRRTEIACMCWVVQTLCGSSLGGLQSYFYTSAGISTSSAYSLSWGQTAIGVAGTICSWFIGRSALKRVPSVSDVLQSTALVEGRYSLEQ